MLLLARFQDLQALEPVICLARFPSTLQVPSGLVEGKAGTPATILQWHYKIISESSKRRVHSCVLFVRMTWRKMKGGELSYSWGILYQGVQKENLLAIGLSAVWSPGGQESPGVQSPLGVRVAWKPWSPGDKLHQATQTGRWRPKTFHRCKSPVQAQSRSFPVPLPSAPGIAATASGD